MVAMELDLLGFFRLTTLRVTCGLAFGVAPEALPLQEAAELVRRITAYFKVGVGLWECGCGNVGVGLWVWGCDSVCM